MMKGEDQTMKAGLLNRLERTRQLFRNCPDPNKSEQPDGWTVKEVLGHLVDSASNNHQRLLRYVAGGELSFPAYDQQQFVRRAGYRDFDYAELLTLWYYHNKLLVHIYQNIPEADLESRVKVGDKSAVSIRQLMEDYITHIELHEKQVEQILKAAP
jgi:hypothetical protein